jgi:hypothetical protein
MHRSAAVEAPVSPALAADRMRSRRVRYEDETSAMRVVVLRITVRQAHTGNASKPQCLAPTSLPVRRTLDLSVRPSRRRGLCDTTSQGDR